MACAFGVLYLRSLHLAVGPKVFFFFTCFFLNVSSVTFSSTFMIPFVLILVQDVSFMSWLSFPPLRGFHAQIFPTQGLNPKPALFIYLVPATFTECFYYSYTLPSGLHVSDDKFTAVRIISSC